MGRTFNISGESQLLGLELELSETAG